MPQLIVIALHSWEHTALLAASALRLARLVAVVRALLCVHMLLDHPDLLNCPICLAGSLASQYIADLSETLQQATVAQREMLVQADASHWSATNTLYTLL